MLIAWHILYPLAKIYASKIYFGMLPRTLPCDNALRFYFRRFLAGNVSVIRTEHEPKCFRRFVCGNGNHELFVDDLAANQTSGERMPLYFAPPIQFGR
jgi:hypothetical protein